ncbi:MAG: hypothetical protein MUC88_17865 [Planctomycetes bacterium]|nr:hypothetical protein [Planctomycetota bacterium]
MARRRRLNRKVALMGTTVLLIFTLAVVLMILRLNRDPALYLAEGDAAAAARDYRTAGENYRRAYGLMKAPPERIDVLFKLAEAYRQLGQWDKVLGCWAQIATLEPQNLKARLGQLKYGYVQADGLGDAGRSISGYWQEVLSQAKKTMEIIEKAGLAQEERARWEPAFGAVPDRIWSRGAPRLGPHLHFVQGRAAFELARLGAVASPGALLQEARGALEEARKVDPNNAQVYRYLAEVFLREGEAAAARGNQDEKEAAERRADELLAEAVHAAGDAPEAHINVLMRTLATAQRSGITAARDQIKTLEPQFEALARRFPTSGPVFAAVGQFQALWAGYLDSAGGRQRLQQAIGAAEQAAMHDKGNAQYALQTASYYYRQYSVYDDVAALDQAIELTEKALQWPTAQDVPGPMQFAHRLNRLSLCGLLAKCCVERILALPVSDPARKGLLARVEKAVHDIGQIRSSPEDPEVRKWQGMLDLAQGQPGEAIRNLYAAYEQIQAANPPEQRDPFLAYTLAKLFEPTAEIGAVVDFLATALNAGVVHVKPEALLDYGDALLRVGSHDGALGTAGLFEERFGGNRRSRALRIKALLAKGRLAEAEEGLARLDLDDPNALMLRLDLGRARGLPAPADWQRQAGLLQRLLQTAPQMPGESYLAQFCEALLAQGETGTAQTIVAAFLKGTPENVTALFYQRLLSEPDPRNCPASRRREIQEQAARALSDPIRRSLELGQFYLLAQQPDRAISQLQSVLDATARDTAIPAYTTAGSPHPRRVAAERLFDVARSREDWTLASRIAETARRENLDGCGGRVFAANLASAKKEYGLALTHLNEGLQQRPVFSYGYVLRSEVQAALGKDQEAVDDARRAAHLNPMDLMAAKVLAKALWTRNSKVGDPLSPEQRQETQQALEHAVQLDPRDIGLLNAYVDFISPDEPEKAVALRQTIQANAPGADNAVKLGVLATRVAQAATDAARQRAFATIAQTAFRQALELLDRSIAAAGPETDAGLEHAAAKAQALTMAYNVTSDKTYLRQAVAVYESLRVKWPKNSSVLNNLAYLLAQNDEKLAEALGYAATALELNPDEVTYLDTYAYVLYKNGKHAQAAQSLATALQKYEVRGTVPIDVYEHLGLVQEALGDRAVALDAYRRALAAGRDPLPEPVRRRLQAALERLAP